MVSACLACFVPKCQVERTVLNWPFGREDLTQRLLVHQRLEVSGSWSDFTEELVSPTSVVSDVLCGLRQTAMSQQHSYFSVHRVVFALVDVEQEAFGTTAWLAFFRGSCSEIPLPCKTAMHLYSVKNPPWWLQGLFKSICKGGCDHQGNVGSFCNCKWLPIIQALQSGELFSVLLHTQPSARSAI